MNQEEENQLYISVVSQATNAIVHDELKRNHLHRLDSRDYDKFAQRACDIADAVVSETARRLANLR